MVDPRLLRALLVPFALAVLVAAFSLGSRPRPQSATLAPDAFDGASAHAAALQLARQFPDRRPGGAGDQALAAFMQDDFSQAARHGFQVSTHDFSAQTVAGRRKLRNVLATRQGQSNHTIVLLAHRDAANPGSAAELSGTAALLELVHVFSGRITNHTLALVSTSAGSGGAAGAAQIAHLLPRPIDAVIALGDLGGRRLSRPYVVPWSDGSAGFAPIRLRRTVEAALQAELGRSPGGVAVSDQLARLALPLTLGEQGPLLAAGLPAVLVQGSGERGPGAADPLSAARVQALGRGVLRAVDAIDGAPGASERPTRDLLIGSRVLPGWTIRLLVGTLILPVLFAGIDMLARMRRRRQPLLAWFGWLLINAMPFALLFLFARILGWSGLLPAAPGQLVSERALPLDGSARAALLSVALVFALSWLARRALLRATGARPPGEAGATALLLALAVLAVLVWLGNPFAAGLLAPALLCWMAALVWEPAPRRGVALGLVGLGLLPLLAVLLLDAARLGLDPFTFAWEALLLVAGSHLGLGALIAWSIAAGGLVSAVLLCLGRARERPQEPPAVTVRGPLSYAGPGSLGGTDSALRR